MAKKARTSRPRRAAAPADGFAAPPADDMDIEEEEQAPRRRKQKEAPLSYKQYINKYKDLLEEGYNDRPKD